MFPDVVSLKQFYASAAGAMVQAVLLRRLKRIWPEMPPGEAMLALGFAVPFMDSATMGKDVVLAMPATTGALYFPAGQPNRVALVHDSMLPFTTHAFNRVLMVHMLEHSERIHATLQEVHRVLTPGGRVLIVVPSRIGVWAQSHASPFGYGRPFSASQLRDALQASGLTYLRHQAALAMPPVSFRWLIALAPYLERIVQYLAPRFGGVLLVEAEKQIYAALAEPVATARAKTRMVPVAAQPV